MTGWHYLVALGSNMRHPRYGAPRSTLLAAFDALEEVGHVAARSPVVQSSPLGPSSRTYANATALLDTDLTPLRLLDRLKQIERLFGRRQGGRRWCARVLDLDIVLWSGGSWSSPQLTVPHPAFRCRDFVLGPASTIAPHWRDPVTGLSLTQLNARLTKPKPLPR